MSQFDLIKVEVEDILRQYRETKPNSLLEFFQFSYAIADEFMTLVEVSKDIIAGADKKATVIEAVRYAYIEVDPNLPWIPAYIENKIEKWFLSSGLPALIDFLVAKYNKHGIFKKSE